MQVKCGHCSTKSHAVYHRNSAEVHLCYLGKLTTSNRRPVAAQVVATQPQHSTPVNPWRAKTPRPMVENMREGRYAVPIPGAAGDEKDRHIFLRVWRPKSGKRKDQLLIRTQHSDDYRDFITIYPGGRVWFAKLTDQLDMALMMIAADPYTAIMKYAEILKVCGRCGKQLTDERSRWYGIGPECEQHWPEVIERVNQNKGPF